MEAADDEAEAGTTEEVEVMKAVAMPVEVGEGVVARVEARWRR